MVDSESLSFQVDFSKEEDPPSPPTLKNNRNSDPIYESVQCSRFLMKRKTNSTKSAPRMLNDYGDLNKLLLTRPSRSSLSSHISGQGSLNSWHSAASSQPSESNSPNPALSETPPDTETTERICEEKPPQSNYYDPIPQSLPRHPYNPLPQTVPVLPTFEVPTKQTDGESAMSHFYYLLLNHLNPNMLKPCVRFVILSINVSELFICMIFVNYKNN